MYLIASRIIGKGATPFILWNGFKLNRVLINSKNEDIYKGMYDMYEKMINSCDVAIMLDNNVEGYQNISTDDILFFKNRYYLKIFQKIVEDLKDGLILVIHNKNLQICSNYHMMNI